MNIFVSQSIVIQTLNVDSISNSAVLQIGTAGIIKPLSQLYNTGGYTQSAKQAGKTTKKLNVPLPPTTPS